MNPCTRPLISTALSLTLHLGLLAILLLTTPGKSIERISILSIRTVTDPGTSAKSAASGADPKASVARPGAGRSSSPVKSEAAKAVAVSAADAGLRNAFIEELRSAIEAGKRYPALARARHEEGLAEISFTLRKDGTLADVAVSHSSGFEALDRAASETLARIQRFKPVPDSVSAEDLRLVIPIEFRLQ